MNAPRCSILLTKIPLHPKHLRVLQEQKFQRLGSNRTHKVGVRLVAATNRNQLEMATQEDFRSEL